MSRKRQDFPAPVVYRTGNIPSLSEGENRVLALLACGYTYAAVAEELGIRFGTVQTYVKRIYRKLGVTSKTGATLKLLGRGTTLILFTLNEMDGILETENLFGSLYFAVPALFS